MSIKFDKNYPANSHINYYENWLYLGSDNHHDYYYKDNSSGSVIGSNHLLSIVCSNEPSDYLSPDINRLHVHECYLTMKGLLKYNGIYFK